MQNIINSIVKNKKGILLIILSSLLISLGQLFWKLSHGELLFWLVIGFILYGIGALLMIFAFKFGKFSVLHPMISTSYIFAMIFGSLLLHEDINLLKYLGVAFVLLGVIFIGGSDD
ncbi:EamA family transporter [Paenibacillus piri]|uniref:EamA/RhaT family transporter n=1 Tax=Paenibacillus piri TaxID=2547395 RepID=A0A4R5KMQ6_9BACL|nr:EamA family transporter [Paenibacillus piri]TDF96215.1 EamA/RhaT family transporter [Paenibacillus piri]